MMVNLDKILEFISEKAEEYDEKSRIIIVENDSRLTSIDVDESLRYLQTALVLRELYQEISDKFTTERWIYKKTS